MLHEGNIGAAKLALEKNGLALPHYSDSSKMAYVLQGIIAFTIHLLYVFTRGVLILFSFQVDG